MYRCVNDFHKLIVCYKLPRESAENVLGIIERDLQKETRAKKLNVLCELRKNKKVIYFRLIHTLFERFGNSPQELVDIAQSMQDSQFDDYVDGFYLKTLAFDMEMMKLMDTNNHDKWVYYKKMVIGQKYKENYISAIQRVV
jgi:hypothetical protein